MSTAQEQGPHARTKDTAQADPSPPGPTGVSRSADDLAALWIKQNPL